VAHCKLAYSPKIAIGHNYKDYMGYLGAKFYEIRSVQSCGFQKEERKGKVARKKG
jgi:hypothetical protein